jgi:single-strand DNA-binding protein
VLWGKRAEGLAPCLTKGKTVYVEGRTETRSWEDDEGAKHYRTEVRVLEITLLGGGRASGSKEPAVPPADPNEEIPF